MMRLRDRIALTLTVCMLVIVTSRASARQAAKPDAPSSAAAKAAREKLDAAVAKAEEQRRLAVVAAIRTYVKELEASLRTVAAAGKTEEVTRIAAELDQAKQDLEREQNRSASAKAKTKKGRVYTAEEWRPVLEVKEGQLLQITASGRWAVSEQSGHRSGPDGFDVEHGGYRYGTLIGRVGDQTFAVGTKAQLEVPADGTLQLACHDAEDGRGNNSGHVDVSVTVTTPAESSDDDEEGE